MLRSYDEQTNTASGDVEWLAEIHDEYVVIAFRGTELVGWRWPADVWRNIRAMIPWHNKDFGWVSQGYLSGARNAVPQIYKYLESHGSLEHKKIILCGHSLGASLSYIAAVIMEKDGLPIDTWVGAGGLNCIFNRTDHQFKKMNFKYRNDSISIYPPKLFGFKQPSDFMQISDSDSDKNNDTTFSEVLDHKLVNYCTHAPDKTI